MYHNMYYKIYHKIYHKLLLFQVLVIKGKEHDK